ncbi:hypothetical protein [Roseibium algae]|uniref:Cysteine rich repeat-containing protein n=1 Tax=Roseibium algae TaxID=3123038 RepID=A0ABU8TLJ8_9HYPH
MRKLSILIAAGIMAMSAIPVSAQTVGFADAIKILANSCGKDINTYCKKANLGNNEIGLCLQENQSKISAQCNTDRVAVTALLEARFLAQAAVPELCNRDIQQYCKLVKPGNGNQLRCILKAQKVVSKKCNEAIDLAGFR